jgi:hypothetical protein
MPGPVYTLALTLSRETIELPNLTNGGGLTGIELWYDQGDD